MRFLTPLGAALIAAAFLVQANADELTLYSHRHYPSDDALYAQFTEKTGIAVKVVKASADELIERLKAEGENTPADIFVTADAGRLVHAKSEGVLQPVDTPVLNDRIPGNYRDPAGYWFGVTRRARIIAYAKDRVNPSELSTYEDLADKKWAGRIVARSSSNIYNQSLLASIIAANGEEKAVQWATAVRKNMARPPQGSDRDQMRAVAAGLADVAIVNTYYHGLLQTSSDEKDKEVATAIGIYFPNQDGRGAHVNVSGAAIVKGSDNKAGATEFLEFLVSDESQSHFATNTFEYPVVEGISWPGIQEAWGAFEADSLSVAELGLRNAEAVRTFNLAGWE